MIKESRYILRRILIGVGIVLVLSCLNGCKVKALSWSDSDMSEIVSLHSGSYNADFKVFYNSTYNRYYWYNSKSPNNYSRYTENASTYPYVSCWWDSINDDRFSCILTDAPLYFYNWGNNRYISPLSSIISVNYVGEVNIITNNKQGNIPGDMSGYQNYGNRTNYSVQLLNNAVANPFRASNYDIYYKDNITDLYFQKTSSNIILPNQIPEIISLNANKILYDNIVIGYSFTPEFSSFDISKYSYQYRIGNGVWQNFNTINQSIEVKDNSNVYFRIIQNNDLSVLDSSSFTITNLGNIDNTLDYDIIFSTDYETGSSNSNDSNIIIKYFVNIDYIPVSSALTYQYQFVVLGDSYNNDNWQTLDSQSKGSYKFNSINNGVLYARILDKNGEQLVQKTFTITSIGKYATNNDKDSMSGFFYNLGKSVGFGGPISSIINIPIRVINVISTGLAGGLTCTDYNLGSLWGTNIKIPCVNIRHYLGNNLYSTIDLIIASCMIFFIFKMFGELYTNLLFIHKNPINDLGGRGDF